MHGFAFLHVTANGVCLHLLVPPLAQCCFFHASCLTSLHVHNSMYCGIISFEGGPILEDYGFSQCGNCERALTKPREPTTRPLWMQIRPPNGCAAVQYSCTGDIPQGFPLSSELLYLSQGCYRSYHYKA